MQSVDECSAERSAEDFTEQEIASDYTCPETGRHFKFTSRDIPGYGDNLFYASALDGHNSFRVDGLGLPREYAGKIGKDFNWNIYPESCEKQRELVNSFVLNFSKFRDMGMGLYIFSKTPGSGKTLLSCCLANEILRNHDTNIKFISSPELSRISKSKQQKDRDKFLAVRAARLLILDDIGAEGGNDWTQEIFFDLIDFRYTGRLSTIYTSNYAISALSSSSDRLKDRIYSRSAVIQMPEVSIRAQQAATEKEQFLKSLKERKT